MHRFMLVLFGFVMLAGLGAVVFTAVLGMATAWAAPLNPDGVAVIIGNRSYAHGDVPEVSYAHRDADAIRRYVIDVLGFRERNVVVIEDASQAELEGAFGNERSIRGEIYRLYREGKSDIVVFYSGHGMPGLSDGRGYLLPVDVDPGKTEINGYPLETLYANLAQLDARSVLVLIDACFSGATAAGGSLLPAGSVMVRAPEGTSAPGGLTVLTAAGATLTCPP